MTYCLLGSCPDYRTIRGEDLFSLNSIFTPFPPINTLQTQYINLPTQNTPKSIKKIKVKPWKNLSQSRFAFLTIRAPKTTTWNSFHRMEPFVTKLGLLGCRDSENRQLSLSLLFQTSFSLFSLTHGLENKQNELVHQNKNCRKFKISHKFSPCFHVLVFYLLVCYLNFFNHNFKHDFIFLGCRRV